MNRDKDIIKNIAVYVMDNRLKVIRYLNSRGYASLSHNASLKEVNRAISANMFDEEFWNNFITFTMTNDGYSNWVVAAVQVVAAIGTAVNSMFIQAKQALFSRNMMFRQEERNKENEQFFRELAELNAKKEMAITMNMAQQDVKLKREQQEDNTKTFRYITMFALFVAGALTIAYVMRKKNKNK